MPEPATEPRPPRPGGDATGGARVAARGVTLRFVAWLAPIAALLAASAAFLHQREAAAERRVHEQRGRRVVDLGAEVVARDLEAVGAEVRYLAEQTALHDYLTGRPDSRARLEADYVSFSRHQGIYDQIRFIDVQGMERVRINHDRGEPGAVPERELQPKAARDYVTASLALDPGQVYVSAFDLNVEHGAIERPLKPVIRFATPVVAGGEKRGVLVLNYLGARLLRKVSESAAAFPGEVALVNSEGYYLLHPRSPEQEWGFLLGSDRTFGSDHPEAWREIAARAGGQIVTREGLFTFRNVGGTHAPAGGLLLVARVSDEQLRSGAGALLGSVLVAYAVLAPLLVGLAGYLAYAGAVRRRHERQIAESEARLRVLSTQLLTAQEEERRNISRDLHDDLGQLVTAVGLNLGRARQVADPAQKEQRLASAAEGVEALIQRVREISARLRPRMLDELGLKETVQSFLTECRERLGLAADADLQFDRTELPAAVSENVYRILQEAATNVAKHARVRSFDVRLHVTGGEVRLTVRDRGAGFDPASVDSSGLGLLGMRERVELLGGSFRVRSAPGEGTEIDASIPVAPDVLG